MGPDAARQGTPLLSRARTIVNDYRFVADSIDALCTTGPSYCDRAERHLLRLFRALGGDDDRFADAIEAFVEMTVDVMRMQERYYRTGQFDAGPEVVTDGRLYNDDDLMGRRYLYGLYLAQFFWPNHLEKFRYFEAEFLPIAADGMRVLEVGTGPGTYGLAVGRSVNCADLLLNDISPLSIETTRRLAAVDPVRRPETLRYSTSDFLDFDATAAEPFDLVVFSEVLEHLRDPPRGLARLKSLLTPESFVFFSTATNAAFYDHTVVFQSLGEIEGLLGDHGFEICSQKGILAAPGPDGRDVVDYVAVIRSARSH
jgi:2-polyprenyl-3-methyl-5-hydroxy-6-metoxy-1,4-benzoquinol methylase